MGVRAEVAVDAARREPPVLQLLLDLPHRGPDHMRLGQPIDDDPRFFDLGARRCEIVDAITPAFAE